LKRYVASIQEAIITMPMARAAARSGRERVNLWREERITVDALPIATKRIVATTKIFL
jgi:hypothetical protein